MRRPVILLPVRSPLEEDARARARGRRFEAIASRSPAPVLPVVALALAASMLSGCQQCSPTEREQPAAQVTAKAAASAAPARSTAPPAKPAPLGERVPVGPKQIVLPGHGITAIRFGATVETIERHMQAPCDEKTETRCLYIKQAIDFTLDKGVLMRAKVHLRDRLVPGHPDKAFGTFYGGMQPDILLGLHRHIVHEEFGEPERSEQVGSGKNLGLVARDFYPGVILEYDKIENGNTVLAAMEVFPADVSLDRPPTKKKAAPGASAASAAPTAPAPAPQ